MIPDAALAQGSDGSWSPATAVADLPLSGGGRTLATVKSGGQSMTLAWPSTATCANVFPGVNLVVTADTLGGTTSATPNTAVPRDPATMIQNLVNSGAGRD